MHEREFIKFYSQLNLPFQETNEIFLKDIFKTLEMRFNLKKNSKQVFIDLGSGNGRVIIYCAINYGIKSIGIEIDPILINEAKDSIRILSEIRNLNKKVLNKIRFISGDFYTQNLKKYDFIYIYSLPAMQKYLKHVFQTAKRDAIIISHIYPLESIIPFIEFKFKVENIKQSQEKSTFFYRRI